MLVPPVPGVPSATWRMNPALMSAPVVLEIHTSATPVTGPEHLPTHPLQLTTGTTVTRASLKVCVDHVPVGSEKFPAATRSLTPWPIGPTVAPGSMVKISPTLTVQEHPDPRFCLNTLPPFVPLLALCIDSPAQHPAPQFPLCNVSACP